MTNEEIIYQDIKGDFSFVFAKPRNGFTWYLKIGDYISKTYHVRVIKPPSIISFSSNIRYPDFLNYKNRHVSDIHSILNVAFNSTLNIKLEVDQIYSGVSIFQDINKEVQLEKVSCHWWSGSWVVKDALPLKILFKNKEGYSVQHPDSLYIYVINDQPPSINVKNIELDFLPFSKSIPIVSNVLDELGINSLILKYKDNNQWHIYEEATNIN